MGATDRLLRPLASGLVAGIGLSFARAPLGLDLASTPATSAGEALTWRGAALALVAVGLGRWSGARPRVIATLWGAALGFGLHGLVLADFLQLAGRLELYGLLALLLVAAFGLRPRRDDPEAERDPRPGVVERVGLLVAGIGLALALEAVARPLRLLGGATPADDAAFGAAFLVLLAFGAAAFGPLVPRRLQPSAVGLLLALAALVCVESLRALATLSAREGLDTFLRSWPWELDFSYQGRLSGDLLIGARVLLPPAFVLGTALVVAARGARLGWLVFGAALGLLALPSLLEAHDVEPSDHAARAAAVRVVLGVGLASVGGGLAALGARGAGLRSRLIAAAACLATTATALLVPAPRVLPLSPWELYQVEPELALETPEGLLTLEPTVDLARVVTLDRRRLTPATAGAAADEQRLRLAWRRVAPAALERAERRVLLVGQLTPLRARVLRSLGATHVDRTGAWHRHMELLEARMFDLEERPAGRILAPLELAEAGPWVLVVAPPVEGAAPLVRSPREDAAPRVVWLAASAGCADRPWGESVMVSSTGLSEVCVAPFQPEGLPAGRSRSAPVPWRRLRAKAFERETAAVAAAMRRLAVGALGGEHESLTAGLARLTEVQVRSSPFEEWAQQIEVDADGLRLLRDAALAREPDLFLRELWIELARLLAAKREIELAYETLEPLAERWSPWWELDVALARADLESLDPASAAERLLRAVAQQPLDLDLRLACASALSMAARPADAVVQLREVDRLQPGRRDVRRMLAMELARAGDPDAGPLLEELLDEDPADDELRVFQGPGPFPPPEVRFELGGAHAHDEHQRAER